MFLALAELNGFFVFSERMVDSKQLNTKQNNKKCTKRSEKIQIENKKRRERIKNKLTQYIHQTAFPNVRFTYYRYMYPISQTLTSPVI